VTDYDVWHETAEDVSVEAVVAVLRQNAKTAQAVLARAVAALPATRACPCGHALRDALITARDRVPAEARRRLAPLVGKYLGK
jgi:5'-methylthioadenosine phosphorylase